MYRMVILTICLGTSNFVEYVCSTSSAIPDLLQECYRNNTFIVNNQQPRTIRSLIEIIRKIEIKSDNTLNARLLATSMLHSVKFDGIRRSENAGDESIIPFRATGEEFYKYKLLVDYLTSGESSLFPTASLTTPELCFLHAMISNTVYPLERGDESVTCSHQSNMPLELQAMEESGQMSSCPIKKGCLNTKWGSISAGHIIAAVASALQQSSVPFERIEVAINKETDKNVTNPPISPNSNTNVNNVWVSTIAGDLATVIQKQATETPEIGTDGFWNDTILPRVYYLKNTNWDMSEADILGGIDGLAIARYLKGADTTKIRLSQLLDMYYSDRGLQNGDEYQVTNRSLAFNKLLTEIDLTAQVASATKLLHSIGTYDSALSNQQIDSLSEIVTNKFKMITGNITKIYDSVETIHGVHLKSPLELIIIVDGSYDAYTAQQIIHGLSQAVEVSQIGSKLGVINGQSGNWMVNVTGDLFELFANLHRSQNDWPSTLSLGRSLENVIYYYQNKNTTCENEKPTVKSILILSNNGGLTDNDFESSLRALTTIKKSNPATNFILITTPDGKKSFADLTKHFWDNDYVLTPAGKVHVLIEDVSVKLSTLPGNIVNFYCRGNEVRLEDYITPKMDTFYEIRKEYVMGGPIVTKFSSSNRVSVCVFSEKSNEICKEITVNDEISFDSRELCEVEAVACNLGFRVSVNSSETVCTELSCRYPDQVKLNIIWKRNSGSTPAVSLVLLMLVSLCGLLK